MFPDDGVSLSPGPEGSLPPGKMRLVLAWVEIHRDDLMRHWSGPDERVVLPSAGLKPRP